MQIAHVDGGSLAELLREEVEARPVVAYRLLELLTRTGWSVRIDRGQEPCIVAERGDLVLESRDESLGSASVSLFLQASAVGDFDARSGRRTRGPRAA